MVQKGEEGCLFVPCASAQQLKLFYPLQKNKAKNCTRKEKIMERIRVSGHHKDKEMNRDVTSQCLFNGIQMSYDKEVDLILALFGSLAVFLSI